MKISHCKLPGLVLIEPRVFGDSRGYFLELWNCERFAEAGIHAPFVQDNVSFSTRGTLRGLHYQNPNAQGKLVSVLQGEVFDVAVDLRRGSNTFGQYYSLTLSGENKMQFYIPPGFAHGFQVVSESALFHYKCTAPYAPANETTIRWDDPQIGIPWPVSQPVLSEKDSSGALLKEVPSARLFE